MNFDMYEVTLEYLNRAKELGIIEDYLVFIGNDIYKENDQWRTRISLITDKTTTDYALIEAYWWIQGVLYTYDKALAISL